MAKTTWPACQPNAHLFLVLLIISGSSSGSASTNTSGAAVAIVKLIQRLRGDILQHLTRERATINRQDIRDEHKNNKNTSC